MTRKNSRDNSLKVTISRTKKCHEKKKTLPTNHSFKKLLFPKVTNSYHKYKINRLGKNLQKICIAPDQSVEFFKPIPAIYRKIKTLQDVGLGYIALGQSSTTLSGGEAQRIKLAAELSKKNTGKTFYILDEPTTGLHFHDVKVFLEVIQKLVNKGNTVLIIEHNMDVIKVADYIIDMGPEGGEKGGQIICNGTPEEIVKCKESFTGEYLKRELA